MTSYHVCLCDSVYFHKCLCKPLSELLLHIVHVHVCEGIYRVCFETILLRSSMSIMSSMSVCCEAIVCVKRSVSLLPRPIVKD